jgi:hypothetical protein
MSGSIVKHGRTVETARHTGSSWFAIALATLLTGLLVLLSIPSAIQVDAAIADPGAPRQMHVAVPDR